MKRVEKKTKKFMISRYRAQSKTNCSDTIQIAASVTIWSPPPHNQQKKDLIVVLII